MSNLIFGIDLGMGANKLYGPQGGLQVLSQVALNGTPKVHGMLGLSSKRAPLEITSDSAVCRGSFYVGEGAHDWGRPVENLDYDRLTGAPEMVAQFYASLTRYMREHGALTEPIFVMAGLPLETMMGDEAVSNAEAVRRWLKGEHRWMADSVGHAVTVDDAKCTSQPAAAYFDFIFDDEGKLIPARRVLTQAEVGVVSIGFNTIELLVIRDKAPVQRLTTGNTVGVRRLLELANPDKHYSRGELDVLLRNGRLDVNQALPIWSREVFGQIESQWGRLFRRFAGILLVGGGTVLLREQLLQKFAGKAIVPDDPILSIARGLHKFALARRPKPAVVTAPESAQVTEV